MKAVIISIYDQQVIRHKSESRFKCAWNGANWAGMPALRTAGAVALTAGVGDWAGRVVKGGKATSRQGCMGWRLSRGWRRQQRAHTSGGY